MSEPSSGAGRTLQDLDKRSRGIFRAIVETYLNTGDPVGSRTLSQMSGMGLSPASIRNTMQDLTTLGLLDAPHPSAGRVPSHIGLRLFVDALLQGGDVSEAERAIIDDRLRGKATSVEDALERASEVLSGLAGGAGLVVSPTREDALRHVEFVPLSAQEALAVLVFEDGQVENRLMRPPAGVTPAALAEAGAFLSARLKGRTIEKMRDDILSEIESRQVALDDAARGLIAEGLADWSGGNDDGRALIVRGHANLLTDVNAAADIERVRLIFDDLERKRELITLLDGAHVAPGVKIFIGAENPIFSLSGSSVITAPYSKGDQRIVGALGVIGPTRLNYARVIPLVDYTAQVVSRILDDG